jgi:hypothetical protein
MGHFIKGNKRGLRRCPVCKVNDESISNFLILCSYNLQVWQEMEHSTSLRNLRNDNSTEECFRRWNGNIAMKSCKVLPLIFAWGTI